jgi:hypothetical protein
MAEQEQQQLLGAVAAQLKGHPTAMTPASRRLLRAANVPDCFLHSCKRVSSCAAAVWACER